MSEERDPGASPPLKPPHGARVSALRVNGSELRVISFPVQPPSPAAVPLSRVECEVAELAACGLTNAEIAERRGRSVRTVANQMAAILRKLGLGSRRELAAHFARGSLRPRPSA